jgi:hypothetical protein
VIGSCFLDLATENSKLPPATLCQPAFENLQPLSKKTNWLRTSFFGETVSDNELLCQLGG